MDAFTSSQVASMRIFLAFLFLSPLIIKYVKKAQFKNSKAFLTVGIIGNLIPAFLFTRAETGLNSSLAGMLNSLTPPFTLLLGISIFKIKVKPLNIAGVFIGLGGAIGLLTVGNGSSFNSQFNYGILIIIATFFYGISVNVIKNFLGEVKPVAITVWAFMFIGPPAGMYLFSTDIMDRFQTNPAALSSFGYVCILAIMGTAISLILFNLLIKRTTALFASSITYLVPIIAIGWGFFDGEKVEWMHFMWIIFILLGVYLVNRKPREAVS